jgi:hypothetical protein
MLPRPNCSTYTPQNSSVSQSPNGVTAAPPWHVDNFLSGTSGIHLTQLCFGPVDVCGDLVEALCNCILNRAPAPGVGFDAFINEGMVSLATQRGPWIRRIAGDGPGWQAHDLADRFQAAERFVRDLRRTSPVLLSRAFNADSVPSGVVKAIIGLIEQWRAVCRQLWPVVDFVLAGRECDAPQYVTLDQVAAYLQCSKKTLRKVLKQPGAPTPDVKGGGGKAHKWHWDRIQPWLAKHFSRRLPEHFPHLGCPSVSGS